MTSKGLDVEILIRATRFGVGLELLLSVREIVCQSVRG